MNDELRRLRAEQRAINEQIRALTGKRSDRETVGRRRALAAQGMTVMEIARAEGVRHEPLYAYCRRHGIALRSSRDDMLARRTALVEAGHTVREIAAADGTTLSATWQYMSAHRLKPQRGGKSGARERLDAWLAEHPYHCAFSLEQIGAAIGVTRERVRQLMGHRGRPKPSVLAVYNLIQSRPEAVLPKADGGMSLEEITAATGFKKSTVRLALKELGYPRAVFHMALSRPCTGCGADVPPRYRKNNPRYAGVKRVFCSWACMIAWKSEHGSEWFVRRKPADWGFGVKKKAV